MRSGLMMTDGEVVRFERAAAVCWLPDEPYVHVAVPARVFVRRCGLCGTRYEFAWSVRAGFERPPVSLYRCPQCTADGVVRRPIPVSPGGRERARRGR